MNHKKMPSDTEFRNTLDSCKGDKTAAGEVLHVHRGTVRRWCKSNNYEFTGSKSNTSWREAKSRDSWVIESNDSRICNIDDCLKKAGVDLDIWEVVKVIVGGSDVTMKLRVGDQDEPFRAQNQNIKVVLKRMVPQEVEDAVNRVLARLEKKSPVVPKIKRVKPKKLARRFAYEICLMDPHLGLDCYKGAADADWNSEKCASIIMSSLDDLLGQIEHYMPIDEIMWPFGNDFTHTDNVFNTTTAGTAQPEAKLYLPNVYHAEEVMFAIMERMKEVAPVVAYSVPGNHDRQTSYWLGRVLQARYHKDKNVTVHAGPEPYKFWRYGTNLVGLEHGHSIKQTVRLAALMANECKGVWADTEYRVWHLGDQHRQGSPRTTMMEEQGVSVEFIPGLTPPNEWHKLKSFNWQKRGAWGFLFHHDDGLRARFQCNIDRYMNELMGRK